MCVFYQVILKWAAEKGFASIPRSVSKSNLAFNLASLSTVSLTSVDMKILDGLQYLVANPVAKAVPV